MKDKAGKPYRLWGNLRGMVLFIFAVDPLFGTLSVPFTRGYDCKFGAAPLRAVLLVVPAELFTYSV